MNCNECIKANTINRCAASIYIPQVSGTADGDYTVLITDLSTGRVDNVPVSADGVSLLVDLTGIELMDGHVYEVKVYEGDDFNEQREITIGVTTGCCVEFQTQDRKIVGTYEILSLDGCE
jgi:hypothetical protein